MITQWIRKWPLLVLPTLAVVLYSLVVLIWPAATLTALRLLFGVYALADGLIIMNRLPHSALNHSWPLQTRGLTSIALGVFMGLSTGLTAPALGVIIVAWVILAPTLEAMALNRVASARQAVRDHPTVHEMVRTR